MPKKKPFVEHQLRFQDLERPLLEIQISSDVLRLRKHVAEVSDPQKWEYGLEGVCRDLLRSATEANHLYKSSVRSYAEVRDTLTTMDELIEDLLPLLKKCYENDLLTDHSLHHLAAPASDVEEHLEPSPAGIADLIANGIPVFWSRMIEQFPVDSCLHSAHLLHSILGRQLETIEEDFGTYEYAKRPESDALGQAVYELWRDYGRDNVKYPGSNSGAPARLYRHLCKIADIPEGHAVAVLRKFGKKP